MHGWDPGDVLMRTTGFGFLVALPLAVGCSLINDDLSFASASDAGYDAGNNEADGGLDAAHDAGNDGGPDAAVECTEPTECEDDDPCTLDQCVDSRCSHPPDDQCVVQVVAGGGHSCARRADGTVSCWGRNANGELGDGTMITSTEPVDVVDLDDADEISAGAEHTCARVSTGRVRCWGENDQGQLGDGTTMDSPTPVEVSGITNAVILRGGGAHTCVLGPTGSGVSCWGNGMFGQLGDGNGTTSPTAVRVMVLTDTSGIELGSVHSCAYIPTGHVYCWGDNSGGQIGNGLSGGRETAPTLVGGVTGFSEVSGGGQHSCGRRGSEVLCWGANNDGQIGTGSTSIREETPMAVSSLSGEFVQITTGLGHTCARRGDGAVFCWGRNVSGQLGDGMTFNSPSPVQVLGLDDAIEISTYGDHTCALRRTGVVVCWGANTHGQVGDGTMMNRSEPSQVPL